MGGGERHDFRKPIICAIKKSLPPPPPPPPPFERRILSIEDPDRFIVNTRTSHSDCEAQSAKVSY